MAEDRFISPDPARLSRSFDRDNEREG